MIDKCIEDPSFVKGREKARSDIWVNIGSSAEKSADYIISKVKETTAKKPEAEKEPGKSKKKTAGKKNKSAKTA